MVVAIIALLVFRGAGHPARPSRFDYFSDAGNELEADLPAVLVRTDPTICRTRPS